MSIYRNRQKKVSGFTKYNSVELDDRSSGLKDGGNATWPIQAVIDKVSEVFGGSFRVYEFESELIASDIKLGEYVLVEENGYPFYKVTNVSPTGNDLALDSGYTAEYLAAIDNKRYICPDVATLRSRLAAGYYSVGDVVYLTDKGSAGSFVVSEIGSIIDDDGIYFTGGAYSAERVYDRYVHDKWFGSVGGEATKISEANSALGNTVVLSSEEFTASSTIQLSRYSALLSNDKQSWPKSTLKWDGSISSVLFRTYANQNIENITFDGNSIAGCIGVEIGEDSTYHAYLKLVQIWSKNNDIGIRASNCFDVNLDKVRSSDNRIGVHIDPVSFGPDGGYTTTFRLRNSYVTDNSEQGLLDSASVQNKMFTIQDTVFEKNGSSTLPQIEMLNGGQVNYLSGLYIEDGTSTTRAIKFNKGSLRDMYLNGYNTAIDLGSGGSQVMMENIKFASANASPVSVTSSGGANASYASMKMCEFDGTPTLDSRIQIYDGCAGDLPFNIPEYSWVMAGPKPQWGVGTSPAIMRDLEVWGHDDTGSTIAANSVYRFNVTISSARMADGFTTLSVTPQGDLPVGLTWSVSRASTTIARVTIANVTTASIVLAAERYLVEVKQFSVLSL